MTWKHFWPWLVWRENRGPFLRTCPNVSRDSKRPKFLPGSHTLPLVPHPLHLSPVLHRSALLFPLVPLPSLFPLSTLFFLLFLLFSYFSPHLFCLLSHPHSGSPFLSLLPSRPCPALSPLLPAGPELRSVCSVSPLCSAHPLPLPPTRRGRSWPRDGGTWRPARRSTLSSRRSSITAPSQCGNSYRSS